jgi:lysophospholipase L1-like esterase
MMTKRILSLFILVFAIGVASAQDWANIKRYEAVNKNTLPPATSEKRVVFMGDSITDFWTSYDSSFFSGRPYFDRGISGQTTGQMLVRFREDVINLKPKVVVILAGINDIAQNNGPSKIEDIYGNIVSMAELAKANHIKVVLSSLLPALTLPWRPAINPLPQVKTLNEMIKTYADKNKITYLDYYTAMADSRGGMLAKLANDAVHPNLEGYKVMEPLAEQAINEAMRRK